MTWWPFTQRATPLWTTEYGSTWWLTLCRNTEQLSLLIVWYSRKYFSIIRGNTFSKGFLMSSSTFLKLREITHHLQHFYIRLCRQTGPLSQHYTSNHRPNGCTCMWRWRGFGGFNCCKVEMLKVKKVFEAHLKEMHHRFTIRKLFETCFDRADAHH